jgi:flagellar biosynthetic protein FliQ
MTDTEIINVLRQMAAAGLKVGGPVLVVILVVGTVISLLQTITQVQEQAMVYVIKVAAVGVTLLLIGPWMLQVLASFVRDMWALVPEVQ